MNKFYYDGNFNSLDQSTFRNRGLLLSDGVFETFYIKQGIIQHLEKHWERLQNGLTLLNIPFEFSQEAVLTIIHDLINQNNFNDRDGILRMTVTRRQEARDLLPSPSSQSSLLITLFPFKQNSIQTAMISKITCRNEKSPLARIKSVNYLDNILAKTEAHRNGFDEAILLNTEGRIVSASCANIFIIKNNMIYTPAILEGALPGIMRSVVIDHCKKNDIPIFETQITIEDLWNASAVFLTNSIIHIQFLKKIDDCWECESENDNLSLWLRGNIVG